MDICRKKTISWWVSLILLLVSLLLFPSGGLAAAEQGLVITVDEQPVSFDVQPYIDSQNRTIVPIRFIGEKLGYNFYWDSQAKEVTVTGNGSTLQIWIGKNEALVNNVKVVMDTVAVLDQGRAMVPLRFIVENMGATISYDQSTKVVNITKNDINDNLTEELSEVVQINSPVVNIRSGPGTQYDVLTQAKLGDTFLVTSQRDGWYQIAIQNGQKAWVIASAVDPIDFGLSGDKQDDAEPVEQVNNKIAVISESVVNVRSGPGTDYSVLTKARQGTTFDITGQKGDWYQIALADGTGWVAGWVVSVREYTDTASRTEEPGERRGEDIAPEPVKLNTILAVDVDIKSDQLFLTVEGKEKLGYSTFRLDNPRRIVLDFPYSILKDPNSIQTIDVDHELVQAVRVAQFSPEQVRVVLDLKSGAGITLLSAEEDGQVLVFQVEKPSIKGKTIVIDAGHGQIQSGGWSDPGAIGPSGLYERDVVQDIAFRTADFLKDMGANVILTRAGDTNLTLAGRADIANESNADIFVSIHCNANPKSAVQGTSTYYFNNGLGQLEARKKLASAVQSELVNAIGRKNLGILQANFAVLRYTTMPSILVETAFISNPEEEMLLADPDFRQKIAEGIGKGIELYFVE
ncbi:MAG: N-acetylmuramoyl-L-alanine amidase [Zhaonellaceae bacterium]|nr:SH3 domain-containing protein [Clostridia bacterium]